MWANWIILLCLSEGVKSLFIKSLDNPGVNSGAADTLARSESHRRMKRWAQYGNRVWNDTVKIGFANFAFVYSQQAQYQVLRECTQVRTALITIPVYQDQPQTYLAVYICERCYLL